MAWLAVPEWARVVRVPFSLIAFAGLRGDRAVLRKREPRVRVVENGCSVELGVGMTLVGRVKLFAAGDGVLQRSLPYGFLQVRIVDGRARIDGVGMIVLERRGDVWGPSSEIDYDATLVPLVLGCRLREARVDGVYASEECGGRTIVMALLRDGVHEFECESGRRVRVVVGKRVLEVM